MKVFIAGGSGVMGRRLVSILKAAGHRVAATTQTSGKREALRQLGAEPVVLNALDRRAVIHAVEVFRPEVIIHQLTALSNLRNFRKFDQELAQTNRLRTEGTAHLLEAAKRSGVRRFVAQSYTGWPNNREGSLVKTEEDPLDARPPASMKETIAAIRQLETAVGAAIDLEGIVLRYGSFYGPSTSIGPGGEMVEMIRRRKFPLVGDGAGVWSFVHVDDAAQATGIAVERGIPGLYNIVDDEPAAVASWLPELAGILGSKPPHRIPEWLAAIIVGEAGVSLMTKVRGSSNAKAKRLLQWNPEYPSWREGFKRVLGLEQSQRTA